MMRNEEEWLGELRMVRNCEGWCELVRNGKGWGMIMKDGDGLRDKGWENFANCKIDYFAKYSQQQ